jgi:hypothetical protein
VPRLDHPAHIIQQVLILQQHLVGFKYLRFGAPDGGTGAVMEGGQLFNGGLNSHLNPPPLGFGVGYGISPDIGRRWDKNPDRTYEDAR